MTDLHARLRAILYPPPPDVVIEELRDGSADPNDNTLLLANQKTRRSLEITVGELVRVGKQALDILAGKRNCRVLTHVGRIVGYFSFMHVWNKSKIVEANDRRKGNYVLAEAA